MTGLTVKPITDHGESHPTVGEHGVGQQLRGCTDRDPLPILELIQAALRVDGEMQCFKAFVGNRGNRIPPAHLLPQVPLPELAVCCTSRHGPQQETVDLNHLLDSLGCCTSQDGQENEI